jgi:hypothetical protein
MTRATTRAELDARLAAIRTVLPMPAENDSQPRHESGGSSPWTVRKDPRMARCLGCQGSGVVRESKSKDKSAKPSPYVRCPCGRLPSSTGQRLLAEQDGQRARLEELKGKGW